MNKLKLYVTLISFLVITGCSSINAGLSNISKLDRDITSNTVAKVVYSVELPAEDKAALQDARVVYNAISDKWRLALYRGNVFLEDYTSLGHDYDELLDTYLEVQGIIMKNFQLYSEEQQKYFTDIDSDFRKINALAVQAKRLGIAADLARSLVQMSGISKSILDNL